MKTNNEQRRRSDFVRLSAKATVMLSLLVSVHSLQGAAPPIEPSVTATPTCCNGNCCVDGGRFFCACAPNQPEGTVCLGDQACYLPDGTCDDTIDGLCCDDAGGVAGGPGSTCVDEACCLPTGACENFTPFHCANEGGLSRGPGTTCNDTNIACQSAACCVSVDHEPSGCAFHSYVTCIVLDEGTYMGLETSLNCDQLLSADADADGVINLCDNCDQPNPGQEDDDADGLPDACDNCSPSDPAHDCTGTGCFNPDQADCIFNANGTGGIGDICDPGFSDCDLDELDDCCDTDSDGDGVNDVADVCPFNNPADFVDASGRPLGDFDGDCFVTISDYAKFIHNFNSPGCTDTSGNCLESPDPPIE